jgi:glycosyltransferase involved in cell wall biosynthesis
VRPFVFVVPGDLATPTGGYAYDRRIIAELAALGWQAEVLTLGEAFPHPSDETRAAANGRLAALASGPPVVIDGLALAALAEGAQAVGRNLIALIHHPVALESGLSANVADAIRQSERTALSFARRVIAVSEATARVLVADYGVPSDRLAVIHPGTDRVAVARRDRRDGVVSLLAVGALVPRKGYDVLVAALAALKHLPWQLTIVGDASRSRRTTQQLSAEVARLGLADRISMAGVVTAEALAAHYAAADLFVLPSRFEGYGMVYAEAMAHGLPVVGTNAGAIPDTVPPQAGVLVPPDDSTALAAVLARLIENPQERERLAAGARAVRFPSWSEQAARFALVLDQVA